MAELFDTIKKSTEDDIRKFNPYAGIKKDANAVYTVIHG